MTTKAMSMVRIFLSEETAHLENLLTLLHDVEKVSGVTVYRGIGGYGESGDVHTTNIVGLSLNLPIVVEFFDQTEKVKSIIHHLSTNVKPGHIVSWPIEVHC